MDNALLEQINELVQERITKKLTDHDVMFTELASNMDQLVDGMNQLSNLSNQATVLDRAEQKQIEAKLKISEAKASKAREKLVVGKALPDQTVASNNNNNTNPKSKSGKLTKKQKQAALTKQNQIQGIGDKPRGRIVGKIVEQTMDGFVEESKKVSNQKLTKFSAPRCASVGKGDHRHEKQREAQAASQVKYPHCRSVVYGPTSELEGKKASWQQVREH